MCLIARAPQTGSELVRLLRSHPLAGSGKSPGAVYPALHRLEDAGLVCSRPRRRSEVVAKMREAGRSGREVRRFREYGLTRSGLSRLREWATGTVTRTEILERPEHLMLRFAFVTGLAGPTAARRFALEYRRAVGELAREMAAILNAERADASPSARLGMELSLRLFEVRLAWARQADVELADYAARSPELDEPQPVRDVRAVVEALPPPIRARLRWPRLDGPHRVPRSRAPPA